MMAELAVGSTSDKGGFDNEKGIGRKTMVAQLK
jgi:hypothetical protein